jgi:hypothetical protein
LLTVRVCDVTSTWVPAWIAVELMIASAELVPTDPSMTTDVPSLLSDRKNAAVPVASADVSEVSVLNVRTPADAAGADVAD